MALLSTVHLGLPPPGCPHRQALVAGPYRHYHYGCDGVDDRGWGCGYRTLQMMCSWLVAAGGEAAAGRPVPSLKEIQNSLVEMGDKPPSFAGSREWIGTVEAALCLDYFYGVPGKLLRLSHVFVLKWCLGLAAVLLVSSAVRKWFLSPPLPATLALTDGTFTFYFNWSGYEAHFPHLQLYQCQEVIARDDVCQGSSGAPLLLLTIKSHPVSGGMRATLRRTWAQPAEVGGFRLQPLFLLGSTFNQKHLELVVQESRVFGDILMWDFVESHRNLSLKERCFLRWAHGHCQQAAFVFKGEEDVFVNPAALTKFLRQTPNASHFIHGYIHFHPAVKRIGRDAIPVSFFPLAHYPHFASEKGFLVPGAALPALYQASLWLPTFPLCGAYWGFLALAAQLPHQHSGDFRTWEKTQDHLTTYQRSLVVHGVPRERIEEVWQELRGSGQ